MRKTLSFLMVAVLLAVTVGCGDDTSVTTNGKRDNVFRIAQFTEPSNLDGQAGNDNFTATYISAINEGLVESINGQIVPKAAESYTISDDALTYTFKIREGITWDDGTAINAHTFVYSFQQILLRTVSTNYTTLLAAVVGYDDVMAADQADKQAVLDTDFGVEATNDYTFVITLAYPVGYFMDTLTTVTFKPVKKDMVEQYGDLYGSSLEKTAQGNGQFLLEKFVAAGTSVLVKNDNYWDAENTKLERVEITTVTNEDTALLLYKKGEMDMIELSNKENIDQYRDSSEIDNAADGGVYLLEYGLDKNKYLNRSDDEATLIYNMMSNPNFKKAISYSIDRKKYTDDIMGNGSTVARTLNSKEINITGVDGTSVPFLSDFLLPELGDDYYVLENSNETLAKQAMAALLEDLNVAKASDLPSVKMTFSESPFYATFAAYIQNAVKQITGYNITIDQVSWSVRNDRQKEQKFEMGLWGWGPDYNDPLTFLYGYSVEGNGGRAWLYETNGVLPNGATDTKDLGYADLNAAGKLFTDSIAAANATTDLTEKGNYFVTAESTLLDPKLSPITPLIATGKCYLLKPYVKGFEKRFVGTENSLYTVSIEVE